MKGRKFIIKQRPQGSLKLSDFELVQEELSEELAEGEILCRAEWLSVDPYMRGAANSLPLGETMPGVQVAVVLKSRCNKYPEGMNVVGLFGWRELTLYKPTDEQGIECLYPLPEMKSLPDSYAIGAVGRPGNTAYFGFLEVGQPKPGEVVVVSAAAGAVGSLVGQIAKLKGCKVIGFCGSDEKARILKTELGFDYGYNYKSVSVEEALLESAPEGVDIYFDNVGGEFSYQVTKKMNQLGRIALCGAISQYNNDPGKPALIPFDYMGMIYKNIKLEGLHVLRWRDRWMEGINQIRDWILEDKIKIKQHETTGFENMPSALISLLEGGTVGKAVVKC